MSPLKKAFVILLGALAAILLVTQLVLGLMIVNGKANPNIQRLITAHQHSGYATVTVSLIYVLVSLIVVASLSTGRRPD